MWRGLAWKSEEWRHVIIAWSNFNSGKANAEWALYVDGEERGRKVDLRQDLTWDIDGQVIWFNHYKYPGKLDEIAIFDKLLTPREARYLYTPKRPLNVLLK